MKSTTEKFKQKVAFESKSPTRKDLEILLKIYDRTLNDFTSRWENDRRRKNMFSGIEWTGFLKKWSSAGKTAYFNQRNYSVSLLKKQKRLCE